jgi:hypothetical protein
MAYSDYSVKGDYDWGGASGGTDWNQTPSVDWGWSPSIDWKKTSDMFGGEQADYPSSGSRWGEAFKKATDYLNQANRSSSLAADRRRRAGSQLPGAQDLGGGFSLVYPQVVQSAPQQSGFSKALGAASGVLGAVAPFTGPAAPFLGAAAGLAGAGSRIA